MSHQAHRFLLLSFFTVLVALRRSRELTGHMEHMGQVRMWQKDRGWRSDTGGERVAATPPLRDGGWHLWYSLPHLALAFAFLLALIDDGQRLARPQQYSLRLPNRW